MKNQFSSEYGHSINFFFPAWLAKSAGGNSTVTVDTTPYMFTGALSLFPAV